MIGAADAEVAAVWGMAVLIPGGAVRYGTAECGVDTKCLG